MTLELNSRQTSEVYFAVKNRLKSDLKLIAALKKIGHESEYMRGGIKELAETYKILHRAYFCRDQKTSTK